MGRIHASGNDVYVDEFDLSGVTNQVAIDIDVPMPHVTAFADGSMFYVPGKPQFTLILNGLHSTASPDYDGEMFTDLTSEGRRIGVYPNASAAGERGYEADGNIKGEPIVSRQSQAILLNVTWQGDTPIVRTQVLRRGTAENASANGTAYQTGAVLAAETAVGILRLLASPGGSGNNTLDVRIESDNAEAFTTPTTQISFTQLSQASVATHEVVTAAGAITDDWWRVVLTYAGAGTRTFNILIVFGIRPT